MSVRAIPAVQEVVDVSEPVGVLNYALTLEHLENAFYRDGLAEFDAAAFEEAGFVEEVRGNIEDIGAHEQAHVDALTGVVSDLGGEPVEEGAYLFDDAFADVATFLATAAVFENTGVNAYQGAAQYLIEEDELLAAALAIHSVEARHASYLNGLTGVSPFPAATDTPTSPDEIVAAITPFLDAGEAEATPEA